MFTTPLGLWSLLGVPAVLLLHLFQRRFRPREVSALFLWQDRDQSTPSGRRRNRLIRTPSFWCELLAALCLGLALGGPRACSATPAQHFIAVLDSSASMAACPGGPGTESNADRARQVIEERIDALPAGSRISLVTSGQHPKLLSGPAALPAEALSDLASWAPGLGNHHPSNALALAQELADGASVLFITDQHSGGDSPAYLETLAVGEPSGNLAITAATRSSDQITVTLHNFAKGPRTAHLQIFATDSAGNQPQEQVRTSIKLAPGERASTAFQLATTNAPLLITLPDDELALDNRAFLVPEPERHLTLATTLNLELCERLGLAPLGSETPNIGRLLNLIPNSSLAPDPSTAHLVIAGAPTGGPRTWTLAIETPGSKRSDLIGPFLKAAGSPIISGITLQGIVWSAATGANLPGLPLVSAGNLTLLTREDTTLHLNLDPNRSTLMQSPDWPVLLSNIAEARRAELPGPARTNLRTADQLPWKLLEPASFLITSAHSEPLEIQGYSALELPMPAAPGLVQVEQRPTANPGAAPVITTLAVNLFGGAESDLSQLNFGHTASQLVSAQTDTSPNWPLTLLIAIALIALILDGLYLSGNWPTRNPR